MAFQIIGVTRDNTNNLVGPCDVYLLKYNSSTHAFTQVAHVMSDSSTGAFTFDGIVDNDPSYTIAAFKNGTPNSFDVSNRNLQPTPSTGSWTAPADIGSSRLLAWYDSQAAGTVLGGGGSFTVTGWNDNSGNAHNLTSSGDLNPNFGGSTPIGGHNAVEWADFMNNQLSGSGAISATGAQLIVGVYQPPSSWTRAFPMIFRLGNAGTVFARETTSHSDLLYWADQGSTFTAISSGTPAASTDYAFYIFLNGASSKAQLSGDTVKTFTQSASSVSSVAIGANDTGNVENRFSGRIGELYVIQGASQSDIDSAIAYALAHWGITF